MTTASLENCKRLFELSEWDKTTYAWQQWYEKPFVNNDLPDMKPKLRSPQITNWSDAEHDWDIKVAEYPTPAYDLGYLLRKLPNHTILTLSTKQWHITCDHEPVSHADTPEDACALLCIQLIEQGVLKP